MEITLNGKTSLLKAGDPAVLVPRRAVHSVKGFKGEKLIFREKPDPAGIYKALYVHIRQTRLKTPPNLYGFHWSNPCRTRLQVFQRCFLQGWIWRCMAHSESLLRRRRVSRAASGLPALGPGGEYLNRECYTQKSANDDPSLCRYLEGLRIYSYPRNPRRYKGWSLSWSDL